MSNDSDATLEQIRRRAGGPGSKAYVAAVGKWLAELGYHPSALPLRPLSKFLGSLTGYCIVADDFVVFGDGPAPALPAPAIRPRAVAAASEPTNSVAASAHPPTPTGSRTTGTAARHGSRDANLTQELWNAMISDRRNTRWYVDLDKLSILEVSLQEGVPLAPVADAPEQFVGIPTITSQEQQAHACEVLTEAVGAERAAVLTNTQPWWPYFKQTATAREFELLSTARRRWIGQRARAWLDEQGLPLQRFLAKPRASSAEALRRRLHEVINQLSEKELMELRVPARFLLENGKIVDSGSDNGRTD